MVRREVTSEEKDVLCMFDTPASSSIDPAESEEETEEITESAMVRVSVDGAKRRAGATDDVDVIEVITQERSESPV